MKKFYLLSTILMLCIGLFAQTVTLTFTGRDSDNRYVRLNRVVIDNLSRNWQEVIYWPDTTLSMTNITDVHDYEQEEGFHLSQNTPNPFSGVTDVFLNLDEDGETELTVYDMNGKQVVRYSGFLAKGGHNFRINLATAQTYLLKARSGSRTESIKMINNGSAGNNDISYIGEGSPIVVTLKSTTNKPFAYGDIMQYVGYGTVNGTELESSHIVQMQNASQTFILQFASQGSQLPIVTTHAVTNITDGSATCGGTVNSDGGTAVTARGICWSSTQNPTISGLHTTNGTGTGSFTSNMTGLTPNITYYVRAYATNAVGTAYGQQEAFNTNPSLATVTTAQATNITTTSVTLGGTVSSDGGSTVIERGVCWGTNAYPSLPSSYMGDPDAACGGGTGSFTYNVTTLTPGTTYYARAYAINTAGTAYGQQITFTALANLPEVTTSSVTNITSSSATCGGNVISDGGGSVTARGVCWGTSQNPTLSNSHTSEGTGTGYFSCNLTGLTTGTTYYVRAYATNSAGTAYGQQMSFTPSGKPTVTTNTVNTINCYSATVGGVVTSDNGSPVTARGVYWGTSLPTNVYDNQCSSGSGTGSYTCTINYPIYDVDGITYYVQAYATNSNGTSYGEIVTFTSPTYPSVSTSLNISNITDSTATCSGTVTDDGGADVTERGICLSSSLNDISSSYCYYPFPSGNGTGSFTVNLTSLTPHSKYFVRAYATNCKGTSFGDTISFTTTGAFTCGTTTIDDYDGNSYSTVKIGSQCWMAQNLRTKHYADGTAILQTGQYGNDPISSYTTAYYYYQNGGYKYNWPAATRYNESSNSNPSGIQGICPTGWHLPSKDEWQQMTDYLSDLGIYSCDNCRRCIGKALASSWNSGDTCTVAVNATGFGGTRGNNYWSSTLEEDYTVKCFYIHPSNSSTGLIARNRDTYSSVRCVSDESIGRPVTQRPYRANFSNNDWTLNNGNCSNYWAVGTPAGASQPALYIKTNNSNEASYNINSSSTAMAEKIFVMPSDDSIHVEFDVQIGGETCCDYLKAFLSPATVVFTPGNSQNTQSLADYSDYAINFAAFKSQTTAGNSYPYVLNLTNGNTVHVSMNVANPAPDEQAKFVFLWRNNGSQGTEPGAIITNFSIGRRSCPGIPTVTDYDGNVYNTLKFGDQCWLRENLRTTCYSDGTPIPAGSTTSTTKGYRYAPDNNPNNVGTYGYLYNWVAAMHGAPTENEIPSAVQGICPVGWHLPKLEEWNLLEDYLGSQSNCYCDDYDKVAKSLAHQEGWTGGSNNLCGVCYNSNTNNASGLGILPSGYYDGEYNDFGSTADYWLPQRSTTTSYYLNCLDRRLTCNSTYLGSGNGSSQNSGAYGKSVRCIHGAAAPTVTITAYTVTSTSTATCDVEINSDGGSPVSARGVCWSTSQKPTISDNHTSNGSGSGSFTSTLTDLTPFTIYYARAYASNAKGTTYGEQFSFTAGIMPPIVTTDQISDISFTTATCGGNVTSEGNAAVTARGVCWSTAQNPTINDDHTTDGSGSGSFTSSITNLVHSTTYYVRAYATNSQWTAYGEQFSFTTPNPCFGESTVTDYDGNVYNTLAIGQQCWTRENLRTTHYASGIEIPTGLKKSSDVAYRYNPGNDISNVPTYGYQYNWLAVMNGITNDTNSNNIQGICPSGWHVPSKAEWDLLINYVSSQNEYLCGGYTNRTAKALASTTGWCNDNHTCTPGNNPSQNNATGFSALPADYYDGPNYSSINGWGANYWSSSPNDLSSKYYFHIYYNSYVAYTYYETPSCGLSVRCLKGDGLNLPSINTNTVSNITDTSANCSYAMTETGSSPVTAHGVCWSTSAYPTLNDNFITNGSDTGNYNCLLTGLVPGSTYCVRAYATNAEGTIYGEQLTFSTLPNNEQSCPGANTLADYDGNTYNTVQIGLQCWMKENLRTTHYSDGTSIPLGSTSSTTQAFRYYPDANSAYVSTYGYLYNWLAVMNGSSSSSANPSGVQGICPSGWHVPSKEEWTQLINYLRNQNEYWCSNNSNYIAKALASTTGWCNDNHTCSPGNNPSQNNATGFSALPAGCCMYENLNYYQLSTGTNFWSCSSFNSTSCYCIEMSEGSPYVSINHDNKRNGDSVRCLKD